MNLQELRSVQSKERQTDSLQHLRESFYEDVSAYVSELEGQRAAAAGEAEDPFADPEVRQLTDEIETAREVVEAIYERRLGKLVKRASLAAADMPADEEGLTAEERALFDDLVERIETNKARVLDVLDADEHAALEEAVGEAADAGPQVDPPEAEAREREAPEADHRGTAEAEAVAAPDVREREDGGPPPDEPEQVGSGGADEDGSAPEEPGDSTDGDRQPDGGAARTQTPGLDERTTVRITGDVDEFYGIDEREYDLDPETVVTLPAANAEPLLDAGDAERVE